MIINGFQKLTLLDFPNQVACMIFTAGCNFNCPYCQNSSLIKASKSSIIDEKEIIEYLNKRKNVLDGIVISGGEPTIQKDLKDFIVKIKNLGLKVKLDTNGYNPKVLKELLDNNLLDYIAMDIKDVFEEYNKVVGLKSLNTKLLEQSIDVIKKSNINHEFRTTIIKEHHSLEKIKQIVKMVGDSKYYIQNFKMSNDVIDKNLTPFSDEELKLIEKELKGPNIIIRGL